MQISKNMRQKIQKYALKIKITIILTELLKYSQKKTNML